MSLLAHRGSLRRSRTGVLQQFGQMLSGIFRKRGEPMLRRPKNTAGMALMAGALACTLLGYGLGNVLPWGGRHTGELSVPRARGGVAPGPIGEPEDMRPLAGRFFLTAAYEDQAAAVAAARTLRQGGLARARLRELPLRDKTFFGLVVYFDGDRERDSVRATLKTVAAPDAEFDRFRKTQNGWPLEHEVR